jgi:hypothetical protein
LYLQRFTSVCFSINHVKDLLLYALSGRISSTPVVSRSNALLSDKEVLGVVDVLIGAGLNAVQDLLGH